MGLAGCTDQIVKAAYVIADPASDIQDTVAGLELHQPIRAVLLGQDRGRTPELREPGQQQPLIRRRIKVRACVPKCSGVGRLRPAVHRPIVPGIATLMRYNISR